MSGSAPLGDGRMACGTDRDGPSWTRAPPRVNGAPLPHDISGNGRDYHDSQETPLGGRVCARRLAGGGEAGACDDGNGEAARHRARRARRRRERGGRRGKN
ncbi:unnamed protein product [Urochloa humidicola]